MRSVVLLVWYVDGLETTDPDLDVKVLEGIVGELGSLSDDEKRQFVDFTRSEAERATAPWDSEYRKFLLEFPYSSGLVEPEPSGER
jgi:hypothetical protein